MNVLLCVGAAANVLILVIPRGHSTSGLARTSLSYLPLQEPGIWDHKESYYGLIVQMFPINIIWKTPVASVSLLQSEQHAAQRQRSDFFAVLSLTFFSEICGLWGMRMKMGKQKNDQVVFLIISYLWLIKEQARRPLDLFLFFLFLICLSALKTSFIGLLDMLLLATKHLPTCALLLIITFCLLFFIQS